MADIKEAIRRLIYEYVVEGADKVMQTQEAVAASTTKTDKASLSLEKAFGGLERRYVETVRYQQDYAKVQDKVNAAVAQNPALQERANAVLAAAKDHYENLAAGATKGGIASSLLSKAIGMAIGPAGALGVAMTALSFVAEKMWSEFTRGRTTVAEALEETNRLLNQSKTAIDDLINAQTRLQSTDQTRFETLRNQVDLQNKYKKAVAETLEVAQIRTNTPLQDTLAAMGQVKDPGYAELTAAVERLNAAAANGVPSVAALNAEVSRIGATDPSSGVAAVAADIIRAGKEALGLEVALKKVGLALQSIAQQTLADLGMKQSAEAAQRMAAEVLLLAQLYPGMSIEVAKQLHTLENTLDVARARGGTEAQIAQELVRQDQLLLEGKTLEEAMAIAAAERLVAEERITGQIQLSQQAQDYVNEQLGRSNSSMSTHNNELDQAVNSTTNIQNNWQGITRNITQADFALGKLQATTTDFVTLSQLEGSQFNQGGGGYSVAWDWHPRSTREKTVPGALTAEIMKNLNINLEELTGSTDSLNATMQVGLSPFYSQDPRTTKLGFRAGTVGNPDWMTGATNANPLDAILGPGATAPGMADGGSFVVGGGYSANDNKMAVFPVASGEQVVVNRNKEGRGSQVVNIDNRIIVNGSIDEDALSKMKVSRYQQAQRMRAGMAQA